MKRYMCIAVVGFMAASGFAFEKIPSARTGAAIQAAIDAVHNAGGGNVRLERAVYPSGTLYLKSNVTLTMPKEEKLSVNTSDGWERVR